MAGTKECFGHCANLSVRYRDLIKQHYLYVDEKKMQECDACPLFAKCQFLRHNEILKDLLRLADRQGRDPRPKIG